MKPVQNCAADTICKMDVGSQVAGIETTKRELVNNGKSPLITASTLHIPLIDRADKKAPSAGKPCSYAIKRQHTLWERVWS